MDVILAHHKLQQFIVNLLLILIVQESVLTHQMVVQSILIIFHLHKVGWFGNGILVMEIVQILPILHILILTLEYIMLH